MTWPPANYPLRINWPDNNTSDQFHSADMNHTATTINDTVAEVVDIVTNQLPAKQSTSGRGAANGYAPLGSDAKVPASYLPSSGGGGGGSLDNFDFWQYWPDNANGAPTTADSGQTYTSTWATSAGAALTVQSGKLVCPHNTGGGQVAGHLTAPIGNPGIYMEGEFQFTGTGTDGVTMSAILWESAMPSGNIGSLSNRAPLHLIFTPTYAGVQTVDTSSAGLVATVDIEAYTTPTGVPQKFAIALDRAHNQAVILYPNGKVKVLSDANSRFQNVAGNYIDQEIVYPASNTDKRGEWLACRASAVIGGDTIEYASKYDQLIAIGKVVSAGGSVGSYLTYAPPPTGIEATDTAAIQAAHDALPARGGKIILQEGVYFVSSTGVTFSKQTHLIGAGRDMTVIGANWTNGTAITCTANGCILEHFSLSNVNSGTQTGGAGIHLQTASESRIRDLYLYNFYDNITVDAGYYWSIINCHIYSPWRYGVRIQSTVNNDSGDMLISGCWFDVLSVSRNATSAVRWETGSGLRIIGCKFNGSQAAYHFATHIDAAFDASTTAIQNSADLFIQNNSIENPSAYGVKIARAAGAYALYEVLVQGNEFMNCPTGISIGQSINDVLVNGNVALFSGTGTGLEVLAGASNVTVGTNRWNGYTTPVSIAAGTTAVKVAPQDITGSGLVVSDASSGGTGLQTSTVDYRYKRAIDWAVNATPTAMWTLGVSNFCGGLFTVIATGVETGVGAFMIRKTFSYTVNGSGVVTVAAVGSTDTAGSTNPAITTTQSTNGIAVKFATAGNAVTVGTAEIDVKGFLTSFKVGA